MFHVEHRELGNSLFGHPSDPGSRAVRADLHLPVVRRRRGTARRPCSGGAVAQTRAGGGLGDEVGDPGQERPRKDVGARGVGEPTTGTRAAHGRTRRERRAGSERRRAPPRSVSVAARGRLRHGRDDPHPGATYVELWRTTTTTGGPGRRDGGTDVRTRSRCTVRRRPIGCGRPAMRPTGRDSGRSRRSGSALPDPGRSIGISELHPDEGRDVAPEPVPPNSSAGSGITAHR